MKKLLLAIILLFVFSCSASAGRWDFKKSSEDPYYRKWSERTRRYYPRTIRKIPKREIRHYQHRRLYTPHYNMKAIY